MLLTLDVRQLLVDGLVEGAHYLRAFVQCSWLGMGKVVRLDVLPVC